MPCEGKGVYMTEYNNCSTYIKCECGAPRRNYFTIMRKYKYMEKIERLVGGAGVDAFGGDR